MHVKVAANNGLNSRGLAVRQIGVTILNMYELQREYELMQADNPDATCKKFTDDELDNLKEVREINRGIGKRLGAIKKGKKEATKK